jgi:hypothetical protein
MARYGKRRVNVEEFCVASANRVLWLKRDKNGRVVIVNKNHS